MDRDDFNAGWETNNRGDMLIGDLLNHARRIGPGVLCVEENLAMAAQAYRKSLLWQTIPVRLADAIDCPPVAGEFIAK